MYPSTCSAWSRPGLGCSFSLLFPIPGRRSNCRLQHTNSPSPSRRCAGINPNFQMDDTRSRAYTAGRRRRRRRRRRRGYLVIALDVVASTLSHRAHHPSIVRPSVFSSHLGVFSSRRWSSHSSCAITRPPRAPHLAPSPARTHAMRMSSLRGVPMPSHAPSALQGPASFQRKSKSI